MGLSLFDILVLLHRKLHWIYWLGKIPKVFYHRASCLKSGKYGDLFAKAESRTKRKVCKRKKPWSPSKLLSETNFLLMQKTPHRQETISERQRKSDLLKYHPNPTRLHTSSLNTQMSPSAFFGNNNFKTSISLKDASFYPRQNLTLCTKKLFQRWNTTGFFPLAKWLKFCQNHNYCLFETCRPIGLYVISTK